MKVDVKRNPTSIEDGSAVRNESRSRSSSTNRVSAARERELWKRVLDLGCLFLALPFLAPVMVVIALWIKLASRGPVFFHQERIGFRGRPFRLYKFRSMEVSVDPWVHQRYMGHLMQSDVPMKKMDATGEHPLIPWGWVLRASGLDELPQVFNVLRGEMSLIGPRPCTLFEYEHYLPWHKRRCDTLPGLTGLWQVSGKNKTTFKQMMDLDIYYTERKSLWLDLRILGKTIWVPISQIQDAHAGRAQRKVGAGEIRYGRLPKPNPEL